MKIIFNRKLLNHNLNEERAEGSYRLKNFVNKYSDTEINFDPTPFVEKIHDKEYIRKFKKECQNKGWMAGVNLTPESYDCSLMAIGLVIEAVKNNNFAVVRPPGHHALRNLGRGFCFFNNDAIVAKKLLEEGKKVAILDIDGHRGDGTQALLKNEKNILIISIHQENSYGGNGEKFEGESAVNFPLKPRINEEIYLHTMKKAVAYITDFNPDIVEISAGFDTYKEDKLLKFDLEIESYYKIGKTLAFNFKNIFAFLSGGYHPKLLECIESFVEGVNSAKK